MLILFLMIEQFNKLLNCRDYDYSRKIQARINTENGSLYELYNNCNSTPMECDYKLDGGYRTVISLLYIKVYQNDKKHYICSITGGNILFFCSYKQIFRGFRKVK